MARIITPPGKPGLIATNKSSNIKRYTKTAASTLPYGYALAHLTNNYTSLKVFSATGDSFAGVARAASPFHEEYTGPGVVEVTKDDPIWVVVNDRDIEPGSDAYIVYSGAQKGMFRSDDGADATATPAVAANATKLTGYKFDSEPFFKNSSSTSGIAVLVKG